MSFQLGLHLAELLLKGFPQLDNLQMNHRGTMSTHAQGLQHLACSCQSAVLPAQRAPGKGEGMVKVHHCAAGGCHRV